MPLLELLVVSAKTLLHTPLGVAALLAVPIAVHVCHKERRRLRRDPAFRLCRWLMAFAFVGAAIIR